MVAALQMYDWPERRNYTDAYWSRIAAGLAKQGIAAPAGLSRPADLAKPWTDPALILGQTCGLPYVMGRCGAARVVGRPCYGLEGANGGHYASAIICRTEDLDEFAAFRGCRAVINEFGSQSGCNALADTVRKHKLIAAGPFFGTLVLSGAHRLSARMVADRNADIAAIDAVAWALFAELEPERHARLSVIEWTTMTPALPFITHMPDPDDRMALFGALLEASADAGGPVGIPRDVYPADDADYDAIRAMAARISGLRLARGAAAI